MSHLLAEAMVEAARTIRVEQDVDTVLDDIVHAAVASLPGINHAGVTIATRAGDYQTRASTDPLVDQLDHLQYSLGEGPCLYALEAEPVVMVNHLRHEQRWPRFVREAARLGLRSQIGLQLVLDEHKMGGLNLYSTEEDAIDLDVVHGAELFAAHAALALGFVRRTEEMHAALATRKVIGQALGMVMERYTVDEQRAFAYLQRVSSLANVKLRDVAADMIAQANAGGSGAVPPAPEGANGHTAGPGPLPPR